jgi:hypothetical protein
VIRGTAVDVRDGRTVEIIISDQLGNQVRVQISVNDETYFIEGLDLADLEEGLLTVSAIVTDQCANSISAVDDTIKDTLAFIDVAADGFGDQFFVGLTLSDNSKAVLNQFGFISLPIEAIHRNRIRLRLEPPLIEGGYK